jgi:hypothetical protein
MRGLDRFERPRGTGMSIDWGDVLHTLAEITIAIIGFSGIIGALVGFVRLISNEWEAGAP